MVLPCVHCARRPDRIVTGWRTASMRTLVLRIVDAAARTA
jgi:hypothetical protein